MDEYQLLVIQQPGSVSSISLSGENMTRRVVTAPPIFQLVKKTPDGNIIKDVSQLGNVSLMVAHLAVLSDDDKDISFINTKSMKNNPQKYLQETSEENAYLYERILEGSIVSHCHFLTDLLGKKGAYFVFEDLSIKIEGHFKLLVIVNDLSLATDGKSPKICCATTQVFRSFPAGTLLDIAESTELSKHFADQGVRIPIKNKETLYNFPPPCSSKKF